MSNNSLLYEFIHHPAQIKLIEGEHSSGKTSLLLAAAMHLGKPFVFLSGNFIFPDRAERAWNEMIEASGTAHPAPYAFAQPDYVLHAVQSIGELTPALERPTNTEWVLILDGIDGMYSLTFDSSDFGGRALRAVLTNKLERQQLQIWASHNKYAPTTDSLPAPNAAEWLKRFTPSFHSRSYPIPPEQRVPVSFNQPGRAYFTTMEPDDYAPTRMSMSLGYGLLK